MGESGRNSTSLLINWSEEIVEEFLEHNDDMFINGSAWKYCNVLHLLILMSNYLVDILQNIANVSDKMIYQFNLHKYYNGIYQYLLVNLLN